MIIRLILAIIVFCFALKLCWRILFGRWWIFRPFGGWFFFRPRGWYWRRW